MSPAFAPSGFFRSNKRRLPPVGSSSAYWASSTAATGSLQASAAERGAACTVITRFSIQGLVYLQVLRTEPSYPLAGNVAVTVTSTVTGDLAEFPELPVVLLCVS